MDYQTTEDTINNNYNNNKNSNAYDVENEVGFSDSLLTFAAVMTFIIMIVGIFGNFLTVVALIKCPKVRNVAAAFIISLCIADLLFCALVLPFSAFRFIQGTWTHGELLCKLIPFIQYGNIGVSLLCIGMITINRYVMIAHHSSYGKIYKRHWIAVMIAFCWIFSYGMQLPTLLGAWGKFDYDPKLGTCSIMTDDHGRSSKTTLFIVAFVIPCFIIIACYAKIFWVVHKSEARLKQHANKQNSIPNNLRVTPQTSGTDNNQQQAQRISSNMASDSSFSTDSSKPELRGSTATMTAATAQKPTRIKDQREVRAKRNEWRITKMVLAIFLSFVVCYLPITIAKVADKDVEHPVFHIFSYILLYLSACINPIIYVIMNKQYRKAYKTVIMCEPTKLLALTKTVGAAGAAGGAAGAAAEKWKDARLSSNNNHSRTLVSQMSMGEQQQQQQQQNTNSLSSSQTPIVLEMTTTTKPATATVLPSNNNTNAAAATTSSTTTMPIIKHAQQLETPTMLMPLKNNGAAQFTTTTTAVTAPPQPPVIMLTQTNNKSSWLNNNRPLQRETNTTNSNNNRIALVGGDIILEEEEELATVMEHPLEMLAAAETAAEEAAAASVSSSTAMMPPQPPARVSTAARKPSEQIYANVMVEQQTRKIPFYGQNINVIPDNQNEKIIPKVKI